MRWFLTEKPMKKTVLGLFSGLKLTASGAGLSHLSVAMQAWQWCRVLVVRVSTGCLVAGHWAVGWHVVWSRHDFMTCMTCFATSNMDGPTVRICTIRLA